MLPVRHRKHVNVGSTTNSIIVTMADKSLTHELRNHITKLKPSAIELCAVTQTKLQPKELSKPAEASIEEANINTLPRKPLRSSSANNTQ